MKERTKYLLAGMVYGGLTGIMLGTVLNRITPANHNARVILFKTETNNILKLNQPSRGNTIFIEDPEKQGEYITLAKYLNTIPNRSLRKEKESKIKKLVNY